MKSGTIPVNFCTLFHLNPLFFLLHFEWVFYPYKILWHWPFGNVGVLIYVALPNPSYTIQTLHFLVSPPSSSESIWIDKLSKNSKFHLQVCIIIIGYNTVNCYLWSNRLTLFIVEKMPAKGQVWSLKFQIKHGVPEKRGKFSFPMCFFLRQSLCFSVQQKWFIHTYHLTT